LVIADGTILVTYMGAPSRRGEAKAFIDFLNTKPEIISNRKVVFMTEKDGTVDGGDILYIPESNDIFVGNSKRTNQLGIEFLSKTFTNCNVVSIHVKKFFNFFF
jgi:N-dimethylarginine dimethylaminohydrolase